MTHKRGQRGRTIILWIAGGLALILLPILIVFLAMSFWPNGYGAHREERTAAARQLLAETTRRAPTPARDPVVHPRRAAPPPAVTHPNGGTITWAELRTSHGKPTHPLLEPNRSLEPGNRAYWAHVTVHTIPEGDEPPTNWADEVDWPAIINDAVQQMTSSHAGIDIPPSGGEADASPQELHDTLRELHLTLDQVESAAFDQAFEIPSPLDFQSVGDTSRHIPTADTALFRTLHYVLLREALRPRRSDLDSMLLVYTQIAIAIARSGMGDGPRIAAPYTAQILATPGVADRLTTSTLEAVAQAAREAAPSREQRLAIAEVHHLRYADRMASNLLRFQGDEDSTWSYFLDGHPARIVAGMTRPMMRRRLQNLARVSWDGTPEEIEAAMEKVEEAAAWGSYREQLIHEIVARDFADGEWTPIPKREMAPPWWVSSSQWAELAELAELAEALLHRREHGRLPGNTDAPPPRKSSRIVAFPGAHLATASQFQGPTRRPPGVDLRLGFSFRFYTIPQMLDYHRRVLAPPPQQE